MIDDIISYRDLCNRENVQTLQRGMNFELNPKYWVILMSRRDNAPYQDKILDDWITIEYEGHDIPKKGDNSPKEVNQEDFTEKGTITQNWKFIKAVEAYKKGNNPHIIKVYEKVIPWVWSFKGFFELIDYRKKRDWKRNVFIFYLRLSSGELEENAKEFELRHNRIIPSEIKKEVWKRDKGKCVICWNEKNLHFDHDLPFSKWGSSLTSSNIRILCLKCNLRKSNKIE